MRAGGGAACLRLRIVLDEKELQATKTSVFIDRAKLNAIRDFVLQNYLKEVRSAMFAEEDFLNKCFSSTRGLYDLLELKPHGLG
jgi:succinylarginine dihydrolase